MKENELNELEVEFCFSAIQSEVRRLIDLGECTPNEMDPYLRSDLENFVAEVMESSELAKRCICLQRRVHVTQGLHSTAKQYSELPNSTTRQLNNLFDTTLDITTGPTVSVIDADLSTRVAVVREHLLKNLSRDQVELLMIPQGVAVSLSELNRQSTEDHNGFGLEKSWITSVRSAVRDLQLTEEEPKSLADPIHRYLVTFTVTLLRMLKNCIAEVLKTDFPQGLSQTVQTESTTHYDYLMYSCPVHIMAKRIYTGPSIKEGIHTSEWQDPLMVQSRARELHILSAYLRQANRTPAVLYGPPGCGKSSVIRWLVRHYEETGLSESVGDGQNSTSFTPIVVACCAKITAISCALQSTIAYVAQELSHRLGKSDLQASITSACEYAEAVYCLERTLRFASAQKPVLLIFEDVERIYPEEHVEMFRWLPPQLPNSHIRIVISTNSESVLAGFRKRYENGCCLHFGPCFEPGYVLTNLLPQWVHNRVSARAQFMETGALQLNKNVAELASDAVQRNTTPLFLDTATDVLVAFQFGQNAEHNESFPTDTAELFALRFGIMYEALMREKPLLGSLFTITLYLACARIGLTLTEMIGVLSLDKEVQRSCGEQDASNMHRIFPVGCLLNLLWSEGIGLSKHLTQVHTDNRCVVTFRHESGRQGALQFWASREKLMKQRHTPNKAEANMEIKDERGSIQDISAYSKLVDYRLRYAQLINSTSPVDSLFSDANLVSAYYWRTVANEANSPNDNTSNSAATRTNWTCNSRLLTEVPYQLVQMGTAGIDDLYKYVIFSFEFMLGKTLQRGRVADLITELYYVRQLKEIYACDEVKYLFSLLKKLSPKVNHNPILLSVELAGRLGHLVASGYQFLGRTLLGSLDKSAVKTNCLVPLLPHCYSPAVQPDLLTASYVSENETSLVALTADQRFLLTLYPTCPEIDQEVMVITWETTTVTKSNIFSLGMWPRTVFHGAYFPAQVSNMALLQYTSRSTPENEHCGFLVLNLDMGKIDGKISLKTNAECKLCGLTRLYAVISTSFADDDGNATGAYAHSLTSAPKESATIYSNSTGSPVSHMLDGILMPCLVVTGDRYLIAPARWLNATSTGSDKKQPKVQKVNAVQIDYSKGTTYLQAMMVHSPKRTIAWFDCKEQPRVLQCSTRGEFLYVGCERYGFVCRFEMNQINKKDAHCLIPTLELSLEQKLKEIWSADADTTSLSPEVHNLLKDSDQFRPIYDSITQVSASRLWLSGDDRHVAVLYTLQNKPRFIGIWHTGTASMTTSVRAWQDSEIRFGTDLNSNILLHFVKSSSECQWIEVVDITPRSSRHSAISTHNQSMVGKFAVPRGERIRRLTSFGHPIDDCFFVRCGNVMIISRGELRATPLWALTHESNRELDTSLCSLGTRLGKSAYHKDLDIVFSIDRKKDSLFTFFNIVTQKVVQVVNKKHEIDNELFLGGTLLDPNPSEGYVSEDGEFLALVYMRYGTSQMMAPYRAYFTEEYVKPHLPQTNYYTSERMLMDSNKEPMYKNLAHQQTIILIYEIANARSGGELRCQISLLGETVFHFSSKHGLFTLRSNYASENKLKPFLSGSRASNIPGELAPKAILSRYSVKTGEFISNAYLDHPVLPGSQIVGDTLLICCGTSGRWLRIFQSPEFTNCTYETDMKKLLWQQDDHMRSLQFSKVFTCVANITTVVLQYVCPNKLKPYKVAVIDMKRESDRSSLISQFNIPDELLDVTPDGELGIDASMRLYNLINGNQLAALCAPELVPGIQTMPHIIRATITADKSYVIVIVHTTENPDPWLVVVRINPQKHFPIVGCAALSPVQKPVSFHSPKFSGTERSVTTVRMSDGHNGRLLVVFLDGHNEFKIFALHDQRQPMSEIVYNSCEERILSLLPSDHTQGDANTRTSKQRRAKVLDNKFTKFGQSLPLKFSLVGEWDPNIFKIKDADIY
ncbi:unnamed protein product [Dicrocoelium dendriticum]|nr:unnamed protein product [Dicrocoelium dendriticum]